MRYFKIEERGWGDGTSIRRGREITSEVTEVGEFTRLIDGENGRHVRHCGGWVSAYCVQDIEHDADAVEQAEALGFESVEQMNQHQRWLEEQRLDEADIREQIDAGQSVIDPFRRHR